VGTRTDSGSNIFLLFRKRTDVGQSPGTQNFGIRTSLVGALLLFAGARQRANQSFALGHVTLMRLRRPGCVCEIWTSGLCL